MSKTFMISVWAASCGLISLPIKRVSAAPIKHYRLAKPLDSPLSSKFTEKMLSF